MKRYAVVNQYTDIETRNLKTRANEINTFTVSDEEHAHRCPDVREKPELWVEYKYPQYVVSDEEIDKTKVMFVRCKCKFVYYAFELDSKDQVDLPEKKKCGTCKKEVYSVCEHGHCRVCQCKHYCWLD